MWEYQIVETLKLSVSTTSLLNELGIDGWELVSFTCTNPSTPIDHPVFVFKRPVTIERDIHD